MTALTMPFEPGLPLLGNTLVSLLDPGVFMLRLYERHGSVVRTRFFGQDNVLLLGPDANQLVLRNDQQVFSNRGGWAFYIERFFSGGLMLMDFDEHRLHRGIMQGAFKKPFLVSYLAQMQPAIRHGLARWQPAQRFLVYPHLKQLTLDIATQVFMGERLGGEADEINQAFVDTVRAGSALVRMPVPGLRWKKGLTGRARLEAFFRARLPHKRAGQEEDLFARLCQVRDEDGQAFSDDAIISHMIFLMMAAHDTTTITLSSVMYFLAKHPEWQDRLRHEAMSLGKETLAFDDLAQLTLADRVIKESLRLVAPVHVLPRKTVKPITVDGHVIPAGMQVVIAPQTTHHLPTYWTNPTRFDPDRFSEARREHKQHPYQYLPFGGGAHMCIGLHFGDMEIKSLLFQLLQRFRWTVPKNYTLSINYTSLPSPRDHLPIQLIRL